MYVHTTGRQCYPYILRLYVYAQNRYDIFSSPPIVGYDFTENSNTNRSLLLMNILKQLFKNHQWVALKEGVRLPYLC